jgi:hypothetical protein
MSIIENIMITQNKIIDLKSATEYNKASETTIKEIEVTQTEIEATQAEIEISEIPIEVIKALIDSNKALEAINFISVKAEANIKTRSMIRKEAEEIEAKRIEYFSIEYLKKYKL